MSLLVPPGYQRFASPGAQVVVHKRFSDALLQIVTVAPTAYEWAAAHPARRVMQGRLPVYAVPLPFDGPSVVVRRNCHGGWARWRRDRFIASRAPAETVMSLALTKAGILTPEVIAYAEYRANLIERRVDVITRELPPGKDFGATLLERVDAGLRADRWRAVTTLLRALAGAGVWHPDLNVKNIYLIDVPDGTPIAALLDVDRARPYPNSAAVAEANALRLRRSLRKWQARYDAHISEAELAILTSAAAAT